MESNSTTLEKSETQRTFRQNLGAAPPIDTWLTLKVVENWDDIRSLQVEWEQLENCATGATLFQRWTWNKLATNHFQELEDATPYVCCVYSGAHLVALLPLKIQTKAFRRILTGLAEPFEEFSELLVSDRTDEKAAFELIYSAMLSADVDYIHLGQMREDSSLYRLATPMHPPSGEVEYAPYVHLAPWKNYRDYELSRNKKTRKNLRNAVNKLSKEGEITHHAWQSGAEFGGVLDRTFAGRKLWLEARGITSRTFSDKRFEEFVQAVKTAPTAKVGCVAFSLQHAGKPIAEQWGVISGNRYYAYLSTWDPEYLRFSPGRLHLGEIIKWCMDNGIETIEFMLPSVPYKLTWATDETMVRDFIVPITFLGKLYANIWLSLLRPLTKRAYYHLPEFGRRLISKMFFEK